MSERASKISKRMQSPGADSATRSPGRPPGKTTRMKRPGPGTKVGRTTQRSRSAKDKKDEIELEPITPFARGLSIGVKFAALTAGVVGLFMGLLGALTYSITEREMDAQITEQGLSVVATLEKTVDRGFWVHKPQQPIPIPGGNGQLFHPPEPDREDLIADWRVRLRELVDSSSGKIRAVSIIEKSGNQQFMVVQWPTEQLAMKQSPIANPLAEAQRVEMYEGEMQGARVRRFDMPIDLRIGKDREIEQTLEKLADAPDEAGAKEIEDRLRELTGAKEPQGYDAWQAWRSEHPGLQLIGGASSGSPWVSVFVQAKRLDEVKAALWNRIAVVTGLGALAGILLTVLIATVLTAPIRELEQDITQVAGGNLEHQSRVRSKDEVGALAHVFNIMTRNLRTAQTNAVERKAFERELNIAKEIQEKLLPERIPAIPGFDIQSHYNSAKEVGGDYYDFIVIDQTHLGLIVADVAGKGIPGAMVMTMARSLVRLASVRNISPADTFKKVNRILAKDIRRGMFVTAAYMVLNVKTRKLRLASAGHNPVVLFRAASGENELLKPKGIALGFDKGTIFDNNIEELEVQLEVGDRIVTYTDGVNEAMNNDSEEFGDDRFFDLVKQHASKSSRDFVQAIVAALEEHRGGAEQSDDITIATLVVTGGAQG